MWEQKQVAVYASDQLHSITHELVVHFNVSLSDCKTAMLRQYLQLLAGQARIEGVELDSADTPLVQ